MQYVRWTCVTSAVKDWSKSNNYIDFGVSYQRPVQHWPTCLHLNTENSVQCIDWHEDINTAYCLYSLVVTGHNPLGQNPPFSLLFIHTEMARVILRQSVSLWCNQRSTSCKNWVWEVGSRPTECVTWPSTATFDLNSIQSAILYCVKTGRRTSTVTAINITLTAQCQGSVSVSTSNLNFM